MSYEVIPLLIIPHSPLFSIIIVFVSLLFLFYHKDTFDIGCNYQAEVDNKMYHVVHDNNWLNLTLPDIAN